MKTINLKNAVKLFLFLLILFSAKAFSFTRFPIENSGVTESKFGSTSKVTKKSASASTTMYNGSAQQTKGNKRFKK